jgi:hypothetical protein
LASAVGGFGAAEVASHLYRARHLANTTKRVAGLRHRLGSGNGPSWPGPGQGQGGGRTGPAAPSAGGATAGAATGAAPAGGAVPAAGGAVPSAAGPAPAGGAGPGTTGPGAGPASSGGQGRKGAVAKAAAKRLVSVGVDAALAAATSGSSTVVQGAAKAAVVARKAATAAKTARAAKGSMAARGAAQQRAGNLRGRLGAAWTQGPPSAGPTPRRAHSGPTSPGTGPQQKASPGPPHGRAGPSSGAPSGGTR